MGTGIAIEVATAGRESGAARQSIPLRPSPVAGAPRGRLPAHDVTVTRREHASGLFKETRGGERACSTRAATMRPADLFFPLTLCLLLQLCVHQAAASDGPAVSPAKRKPGWGKRQTDWSYVDPTLAKRKPGWGKREFPVLRGRSDSADWDTNALDDVVSDQIAKRRPGWGKRQVSWSNMDSSLAKRKPGWGKRDGAMDKRVPGWGRRSGPSDVIETLKRKPGWGKRSGFESVSKQVPGDTAFESYLEKRKPGWGKRKGTFSDVSDEKCRDLEKDADYFIHKAVEEKICWSGSASK